MVRFELDFNTICKKVFRRHSDDIETLNRLQLGTGTRADGSKLPPYSRAYQKVRLKNGRPIAPKDLNLTGKFYSGFYSLYFDKTIEIGSRDPKEGFLEAKWDAEGEKAGIHGLTDKSKELLLWEYGAADEIVEEAKDTIVETFFNQYFRK